MTRPGAFLPLLLPILAGLTAAGCAAPPTPVTTTTAPSTGATSADVIVSGTALPAGYHIDPGRSLILGEGDNWTGRLSYTATGTADEVFDFLRREMPNFGWQEINSVRSDISFLTFASPATSRIATLQIDRGTVLGSTRVDMIVSLGRMPEPAATAAPPAPRPKPRPHPPAAGQPIS
jgi:hypothetical protein